MINTPEMKTKILFLHGALGSKNQFDNIIEGLQNDFDCYAFNLEGHGGRPSDDEYTMDRFSKNVIQYLDENHISRISIFGYSMGGYVALNTALQHPTRIDKILTLGTKIDWNPVSAAKEVKMLNPDKIEEKVPHFAEKLKKEHQPLDWKTVLHKTGQMMLSLANDTQLKAEAFSKINHEICIGIGTRDHMVSLEESEWVSQQLPNAKLHQLEGIPHPIEKADTTTIIDYIKNNV